MIPAPHRLALCLLCQRLPVSMACRGLRTAAAATPGDNEPDRIEALRGGDLDCRLVSVQRFEPAAHVLEPHTRPFARRPLGIARVFHGEDDAARVAAGANPDRA